MITPAITRLPNAVPAIFFAFSSCFRPISRLKLDAPPIPSIRPTAVASVVSGNATFVAAFPYMPTP